MPAFTMPIGTEVTVRKATGQEDSIILSDTTTVSWPTNKAERDKEKKKAKMFQTVPQTPQLNAVCDYISSQAICIGSMPVRETTCRTDLVIMDDVVPNKTKKGNTMFDYDDEDACDCVTCRADKLSPEKRYLINRTNSVEGLQASKIPATYHLEDDPSPRTANELVQRIKDGKFVVSKDKGDQEGNWPNFSTTYIEWRDPAVTKDVAGAQKTRLALEAAVTKTMDTIVVGDTVAALAAVNALEAQTF